jgi:hypothetical protein
MILSTREVMPGITFVDWTGMPGAESIGYYIASKDFTLFFRSGRPLARIMQ